MVTGSRPDRRIAGLTVGTSRGAWPSTARANAAMCSGVVPQHPPTTFSQPFAAHSPIASAISSGPSS